MGEVDTEYGVRPKTVRDPGSGPSHTTIEDLPDEVLEYIFKIILPYGDFTACSRVSRRWRRLCFQACKSKLLSFHNQVSQGELLWQSFYSDDSPGSISRRYSHSCVYSDLTQSIYVFGGCTSSTSTFNDLLQFNLTTRTWSRPRAIGTYPSPKALATMVEDGRRLILFGGCHTSFHPLHQSWKLSRNSLGTELHIFDIVENRWCQIQGQPGEVWPPPSAGHSATLHGDQMVVFGGLQKEGEVGFFNSSSNIWVFSLSTKSWHLQPVLEGARPSGRYGQSQIYLDARHLLVLGGCVGHNSELADIWLLEMAETGWKWAELEVRGVEHRGKDIWRHPACRASQDRVVVLGRSRVKKTLLPGQPGAIKPGSVPAPHHVRRNAIGTVPLGAPRNQGGGIYSSSSSEDNEPADAEAPGGAEAGGAADRAGVERRLDGLERELNRAPLTPKQRMLENRQRQLASLNRMEERIRNSRSLPAAVAARPSGVPPPSLCPNHRMALCVLDTSQAIDRRIVTWLPPSTLQPGSEVPQECILYSLVKGRTELILFGGLQPDISLTPSRDLSLSSVSNSLHILYPRLDNI